MEKINFKPQGVCAKVIQVIIEDNKINKVTFVGGCQGNAKGISALVEGMDINEVITKLDEIACGNKATSCPDQLAKCLKEYLGK